MVTATKGSFHTTKEGYLSTSLQARSFVERLLWWQGKAKGAVKRVASLGYTGVITSSIEGWEEAEVPIWLHFKSPDCSPLDEQFLNLVWDSLGEVEGVAGIFWESVYQTRSGHRDQTDYDLLLRELQTVEAATDGLPLIFYPSSPDPRVIERQASWLEDLLIDAGEETTIAFSSRAGEPTADHLSLHPFWQRVVESPSHTKILPILNSGSVQQGEGLWPIDTSDLLTEVLHRMQAPGFHGAIALTASVPEKGCTLDRNLTIASKSLQGLGIPAFLLEEELCSDEELLILKKVRSIHLSLGQFLTASSSGEITDAEPQRVRTQSLLAQLNELSLHAKEESLFQKQLSFFIRDAKRLLYQQMQAMNITLSNVFSGDDMKESFWTEMTQASGKGISFGGAASLLPEPRRGEEGSAMEQIYLQTYPAS